MVSLAPDRETIRDVSPSVTSPRETIRDVSPSVTSPRETILEERQQTRRTRVGWCHTLGAQCRHDHFATRSHHQPQPQSQRRPTRRPSRTPQGVELSRMRTPHSPGTASGASPHLLHQRLSSAGVPVATRQPRAGDRHAECAAQPRPRRPPHTRTTRSARLRLQVGRCAQSGSQRVRSDGAAGSAQRLVALRLPARHPNGVPLVHPARAAAR